MFARKVKRPNWMYRQRIRALRQGAAVCGLLSIIVIGTYWILPVTHQRKILWVAEPVVKITGHGFGHGRGMGQWGAYGYSLLGWDYATILHYYYGNFTFAAVNNPEISVELTREKYPHVYSAVGVRVGDMRIRPGYGVRLAQGKAYITQGCSRTIVQTLSVSDNVKVVAAQKTTEDGATMLRFCADNAPYRGSISVKRRGRGYTIINHVLMEDYLRSVIPSEMPARWYTKGGVAALEAQAVCARSYAAVEMIKNGILKDNTENQMYLGIRPESPYTDNVVAMTRNLVMAHGNSIVFAEYSSSTGGVTMGGQFPTVLDAGDVISPYHTWTRDISQESFLHKLGFDHVVAVQPTVSGPHSREGSIILTTDTGKRYSLSEAAFSRKFGLPSSWIEQSGPVTVVTSHIPPSYVELEHT